MAKTLYFGGEIITMAEPLYAEALLIDEGRIVAVGSIEELERKLDPEDEKIDLKGYVLTPAFIDAHSHITSFSDTVGLVQLDGVSSMEELQERIRAFREERHIPAGRWISGFGYDNNELPSRKHPDRHVLDAAVPENPIVIANKSGHMGVMNTLALETLGISASTPDPEGGRIGRESDGKTPNGYLEETAFIALSSNMPKAGLDQRIDNLVAAQDVYFSYGITTAQDGITKRPDWELLQAAAEAKKLKIDVVSYIDQRDNSRLLADHPDYAGAYRNRLRIGGYKIFLDGSPQGRTAWMTEPYEDSEDGYRGYPVYTDAEVTAYLSRAFAEGRQILAHCNGDAAAAQFIACCGKALDGLTIQQRRGRTNEDILKQVQPVMIHAQLVRRDQLAELAKLHMVASMFIAHVWYWGDVHRKNFGDDRAMHISPARTAVDDGVLVTFHQDTPVIPPDMLQTVWCAVNRITKAGVLLGAEERITPLEALKAVTINAARQYHEEDEKGSFEKGKQADMIVLDRNPMTVLPMEIKSIKVLRTVKCGEVVYDANN